MNGDQATGVLNNIDQLTESIASYFSSSDPDVIRYLRRCADNFFRAQRFVAYAKSRGSQIFTFVLKSDVAEYSCFKRLWEKFRHRFFRRYAAKAFGILERNQPFESKTGLLHAHVLVIFPSEYSMPQILTTVKRQLTQCWREVHKEYTGISLGRKGTTLALPFDGTGEALARYIAKAFNRGPFPARWGNEKNQRDYISANLPKLWGRDEVPTRTASTPVIIERLRTVFGVVRFKPRRCESTYYWPGEKKASVRIVRQGCDCGHLEAVARTLEAVGLATSGGDASKAA